MLGLLFPNQPHLVEQWWVSHNLAFKSAPIDVVVTNPQAVVQYLRQQFSGDFL